MSHHNLLRLPMRSKLRSKLQFHKIYQSNHVLRVEISVYSSVIRGENRRKWNLLGQGGVPHVAIAEPCLAPPGHFDGSSCTLLAKHGLDHCCVPPPHVALHPPVSCQPPQTPSVSKNKVCKTFDSLFPFERNMIWSHENYRNVNIICGPLFKIIKTESNYMPNVRQIYHGKGQQGHTNSKSRSRAKLWQVYCFTTRSRKACMHRRIVISYLGAAVMKDCVIYTNQESHCTMRQSLSNTL